MRLRTLLHLAAAAIPSAAALALLDLYRASREREDAALDEVARLEGELAGVTQSRDFIGRSLDIAHDICESHVAHRRKMRADIDAARATADTCYETGWRAVADRNAWRMSRNRMAGYAEAMATEADSARGRAEAALAQVTRQRDEARASELRARDLMAREHAANCADRARAEAAEKARDEAVARVAELEGADAAFAEGDSEYQRTAFASPAPIVEPAAVAPVACTWCGKPADEDWEEKCRWFAGDAPGEVLAMCKTCWRVGNIVGSMVRARHAARTASATSMAAVEPAIAAELRQCIACGKMAKEAGFILITVGDSESICAECMSNPGMTSDRIRARLNEPCHKEGRLLGSSPIPQRAPAPTQDDLDDAAVRALLERGPATWMEMVCALPVREGAARVHRLPRVCGRVGVCGVPTDGVTTHYALTFPHGKPEAAL